MKNSVVSEEEIRKIVRKALLKESGGKYGGASSGNLDDMTFLGGVSSSSSNAVRDGAGATGDISDTGGDGLSGSHEVDSSKLKRKGIDLNSVREMSQKTGLRADFVYGIQSRESAGNPSAMALNPHITISTPKGYSWAVNDAKLKKFMGNEGKKKWQEAIRKMKSLGVQGKSIPGVTKQGFNHPVYQKMRSVDPELAILGNALGYYQVLGGHLLPYWDFSAEKMEREFENDPKGFSHKAFIIWVKKHPNFLKKVNEGEENWRAQVASYYGEDNKDYTDHVIAAAKEYRDAVINNQTVDGVGVAGVAGSSIVDGKGREWIPGGQSKKQQPNFFLTDCGTKNYRSGQPERPTPEFFKGLKEKYGINTVITLNADKQGVQAAAKAAGLKGVYVPLGSAPPSNDNWEKIKKALDSGNTLTHCTHGADRTGAVMAKYAIERCGKDKQSAYNDALTYGFKPENFAYSGGKRDPNKALRVWILS